MLLPDRALAPAVVLALAGCGTVADLPTARIGEATLLRADGVPAGTVHVMASEGRVTLAAAATGIPSGAHGIHLHTVGSCRGPDFASAGGHLNPLGRMHGSANPAGPHAGDLPNLTIRVGGSGSLTADLEGSPAQVRNWLFDADGTAVVIHADADDYRTDPSGNSGARIACGVLRPS